ncbi:hypothetical protein Swit_4912 (plasmid) [Rhizorhabdus wittichii RW1]|uniref:SDR family NAD(P)-dependent oxidoreductase n=1 Tax=Rhizorhabdus wittichii (strain DSM 6014 / CCUG 31198 / JCM 15750 / NBRC 105917 / EY 4224 / RW1) TaxID=392499 RepID=A0A9J9HH10_RHIWR|nr:hypothetical protein Swit_4912 [Rhizorhabdus wittichii RW1]
MAIGYNTGAERADTLRASLPGGGHSIFAIAIDDPDSVRVAALTVEATHGRADILVNSAGTTRPVPHANLDALDEVASVNVV